jgi:hypothetical protein
VFTVTNLNDSGAGSLRAALGSDRIIRFSVAGTIKLSTALPVFGQNITIDGFSAPSPGITLTGSSNECMRIFGPGFSGGDAANVIVQGIRVRGCGNDGIGVAYGAHDIVIDHVSTSGAGDGNIDITTGAHDVTVSWSILANNAASGAQLIKYDAYHVTSHHNIYYNNYGNSRVPWCEGGDDYPQSGPTRDFGVICDLRYNVMSRWLIGVVFLSDGITATYGNVVSNYFDGQDAGHAHNAIDLEGQSLVSAYLSGNASQLPPSGCPFSMINQGPCPHPTLDSMSEHAEYSVPAVSGPAPTDEAGRIAEWTNVINHAGVTYFPDDAIDAAVRSGITAPGISLFSKAWNH